MTQQKSAPSGGGRENNVRPRPTPLDEGWSWVVLAASSVGFFLVGLIYTTGIFNIVFLEVFHMNKQATAWIGSLPGSLMALCGPISSSMTNHLGPRTTVMVGGLLGAVGYFLTAFASNFYHVFLSFGLLSGIGFGICYVPCIVMVGFYFEKYRNLAFGIVNTAIGLGTVVLPFLVKFSIETFAWRGSMYIVSGLFLNMCVCGAVFRPVPKAQEERAGRELTKAVDQRHLGSSWAMEVSASIDRGLNYLSKEGSQTKKTSKLGSESEHIDVDCESLLRENSACERKCSISLSHKTRTLLADKKFHLVSASLIVMHAGNFIPFVHFPAYAMENGASVTQATTLLSVIGVCSILSRLIGGAVTNHKRVRVTPVYLCSCAFCALLFFFSPIMLRVYPGQLAFAACFGFWGNWCNALLAPLTVELFSLEQLSTAFGIECLMCGIGILIGPPLAGAIYDMTGTYSYGFYAAGGLYGCGLVLMLAIPIEDKIRRAQARKEMVAQTDDSEAQPLPTKPAVPDSGRPAIHV